MLLSFLGFSQARTPCIPFSCRLLDSLYAFRCPLLFFFSFRSTILSFTPASVLPTPSPTSYPIPLGAFALPAHILWCLLSFPLAAFCTPCVPTFRAFCFLSPLPVASPNIMLSCFYVWLSSVTHFRPGLAYPLAFVCRMYQFVSVQTMLASCAARAAFLANCLGPFPSSCLSLSRFFLALLLLSPILGRCPTFEYLTPHTVRIISISYEYTWTLYGVWLPSQYFLQSKFIKINCPYFLHMPDKKSYLRGSCHSLQFCTKPDCEAWHINILSNDAG